MSQQDYVDGLANGAGAVFRTEINERQCRGAAAEAMKSMTKARNYARLAVIMASLACGSTLASLVTRVIGS